MAKTKTKQALQGQPLAPALPVEKTGFYNMPDSPASDLVFEVLGAGENIADLPNRKKLVNHNTAYEVLEKGKRRQITVRNQKSEITVELSDIEKVTGSNKTAKKFLALSLIKANEQAIHDGQLTRDYISFPLQELIDIGFYSTPQSARKGFRAGYDTLTSVKVKGKVKQTSKKEAEQESVRVLFTGYDLKRGQCIVYLNENINWAFLVQYFTILPRYAFGLSNRAFDLLYYIFFLARQHTNPRNLKEVVDPETKEKNTVVTFNISFRAIQTRLQLPSEIGSPNPQRDIKDAIEAAIAELETEHSTLYGNTEFSLLPVCDETAPIADYLDRGYLKVELSGDFAETFIAISQETTKQIEQAHKRQERITEKAVAVKMAKKLEAEENAKEERSGTE